MELKDEMMAKEFARSRIGPYTHHQQPLRPLGA